MRVALIAAVLITACGRNVGPAFTVRNAAGMPVRDVTIMAKGMEQRIPLLRNSETVSFRAPVRGESGVAIASDCGGRRLIQPASGYIEGNAQYVATITFLPDCRATVETSLAYRP